MAAMNMVEAEAYVPAHVDVGHELVALAKRFIVDHFDGDTTRLMGAWLAHINLPLPRRVEVHSTLDPEPTLIAAAKAISAQLAFCEAIWALIHAGVILPATSNLQSVQPRLEYTTAVFGSGTSGGWGFPELNATMPHGIWRAPSWTKNPFRSLSDGDLFLQELALSDVHPIVEESLREAVRCFRHDLYTPCLAMLARAVEAAWSQMGLAMAEAVRPVNASRAESVRNELLDPQFSLSKRLTRVSQLYDERSLSEPIWKASDIGPRELRTVLVWADQVRDSRNVLHYQSDAAMANTYEKVAALLIGAVPSLRTMHAIRGAADTMAAPT